MGSGAVRATQCAQGDDQMRAAAEDLVALPLAIARAVALRINDAVGPRGGSRLLIEDGTHTNKPAVVEVDGAGYAKHVDNVMGASCGDARKLTAIYYLNPHWDAQAGGHLRCWSWSRWATEQRRRRTRFAARGSARGLLVGCP